MTVVMTAVMTPTWTLDLHLCRRHQRLKEGGGGGGGGKGGGKTRWEERNSITARCMFNFCDL